ncbi:MAG: winged helix-turn-helix transcriptional regulator [Clostridia bacterium]|nr:winged helix-turn-helix transcriptional regulator [Clostridia bacterium]
MKFIPETGVLYDTLVYLTAAYAEESAVLIADSDDMALFESIPSLPKIPAPFFFCRDSRPAPVMEFFMDHLSCGSISELTDILDDEDERDNLRRLVTDALFGSDDCADSHGDCSMKTAMRLDKTDYPADFKYQALLCLTYFRHAVTELCRTLREVGGRIEKLHGKQESECTAVFSEIRSGRYDRLYPSAGFDPAQHNEITVSISLLRPDVLLFRADNGTCRLIAGIRHTDALIRAFDEDSIDLDRFFDNFGNEIRRLILEALAENGEMTASDLSRSTGIPVTTVLRHIDALTEDYLLSVSRRKGLQIFYALNREYIGKARRKADRYFAMLSGNDV